MIKADIFDGFSDDIKFKYKYIYCYFVANYLHQNIAKNEIRQHITQIAKSLHNEQAANIVMFLCHLSKDAIIINSILEGASNIFQNFPECDLKEDVAFLQLTSEDMPFPDLPKVEDKDKSRQKVLKEQDDIESRKGKQDSTDYPTIKSASQDSGDIEASQVNASFKTIQILGQILTNFQGKMIGEEKEVIAKTCFSLSLRVISSFLKYITTDQKDIIQLFEEKIRDEHPELAPSEIRIKSQKYLFQLSEFMVLAIIKHTSDSVGLPALSELFDIIFNTVSSTPYRILSLSIKLDYYRGFPIKDLETNIQSEHSNYFTKTLIQHLVWLHFYLYEVDYATRQRVGELIQIDGTQKILIKTKQKLLTTKSRPARKATKRKNRKSRRKGKKGKGRRKP